MSAPARVLVTRSEPGAGETAARLSARGYQPVVEPVFAIAPLPVTLPDHDALAFTSANGVRRVSGLLARRDQPVFCVGARTADEARARGFSDIQSADGDVAALAALILARLPAGQRLLHAGNEESRGDLAGALRAAGRDATFLAVFRAEPVAAPGPVLARHLGGEPMVDAVLIHSARAAQILATFAAAARAPAPLDVVAISDAAGVPLRERARSLRLAKHPHEESLLAALAEPVSS